MEIRSGAKGIGRTEGKTHLYTSVRSDNIGFSVFLMPNFVRKSFLLCSVVAFLISSICCLEDVKLRYSSISLGLESRSTCMNFFSISNVTRDDPI